MFPDPTNADPSEAVQRPIPSSASCQPVPVAAKTALSSQSSNVAIVRPGTATSSQGIQNNCFKCGGKWVKSYGCFK